MADSVGKAILTIVPKFEQGGLMGLENELEASGKTGGTKFAGGFGSVIKGAGVAAVMAEAGKIAAEVFTDAFQSAADYEQLVGGVETLFGESADVVKSYAQEAYKSAGISANSYMEQVTSFAAALTSELGNESWEAAEMADTAIRDMADNANKMGSSMESIQNAYQGFAKGNYTMLDNLKLGYGGTKTEMERLIADANALREEQGLNADLTIDSFADIITAIHEVQVDYKIYGTTSKEAADTVIGSLSMMKASWQNMLTAIGTGEDIERVSQELVDSFITVLGNIIPLSGQVIVGMGEALLINLGKVAGLAQNWIGQQIGLFFQAGGDIVRGLANGIASMPGLIVEKVKQICSNALDAVKSFFGIHSPSRVMMEMGGYVGKGLAIGISGSKGEVSDAMYGLMGAAYNRAKFAGSSLSVGLAAAGSVTNNVNIGEISANGDVELERAVLNVIGKLQLRGRI